MVIALARQHENGAIRESFRTLARGAGTRPSRAFAFIEAADEAEPPAEEIDLMRLAREKRP
jgi:hypothetical protein